MNEHIIPPRSGLHILLEKGRKLQIIDLEGRQVVDFFAVSAADSREFLSSGVTMDCNESLNATTGDRLFTSRYNPMFTITADTVGVHDLLHPCCRTEMYDFFYGNGEGHPNCLDNINGRMEEQGLPLQALIRPFNIFMNTRIEPDGRIRVLTPASGPGDLIELQALMDVHIFLATCSVSESECNGGRCTPVKAVVI